MSCLGIIRLPMTGVLFDIERVAETMVVAEADEAGGRADEAGGRADESAGVDEAGVDEAAGGDEAAGRGVAGAASAFFLSTTTKTTITITRRTTPPTAAPMMTGMELLPSEAGAGVVAGITTTTSGTTVGVSGMVTVPPVFAWIVLMAVGVFRDAATEAAISGVLATTLVSSATLVASSLRVVL